MSERYTIVTYPNFGYRITDEGDIVQLDGTAFAPGETPSYVSNEHLAIAEERKRRAARGRKVIKA
jgi:hypothetical protein